MVYSGRRGGKEDLCSTEGKKKEKRCRNTTQLTDRGRKGEGESFLEPHIRRRGRRRERWVVLHKKKGVVNAKSREEREVKIMEGTVEEWQSFDD